MSWGTKPAEALTTRRLLRGLRCVWERGPRSVTTARDQRGNEVVRTGKRRGPVVQQDVALCLVPKGPRS